jgi:hypothetical protein
MKRISLDEARKLLVEQVDENFGGIPTAFKSDMIQFLFPVDQRPVSESCHTKSLPEDQFPRTSLRREEDEARRKAMHALVTNWDSAAKTTSKQLIDVLFRGIPPINENHTPCFAGRLENTDVATIAKFISLIPGCEAKPECVLRDFSGENGGVVPRLLPVSKIGGYSITETVGPLSMLSRVCRNREPVIVWVKERLSLSHSKRRVSISTRRGRIVLFDRYMNLVFVPAGNAANNWQFIRGHVILLVQRLGVC